MDCIVTKQWRSKSIGDNRVAVEKLDIHKKGMILGDGKWSVASYKSLVGHLGAT